MGDYDTYNVAIAQTIAGTDVKYYDFNLCRENYFAGRSDYFWDVHHLNNHGAKIFSELFADFVTGEISEEELFYDSCAEKLAHMEPMVYGIGYEDTEPEDSEEKGICTIEYRMKDKTDEVKTVEIPYGILL